MTHYTTGQNTAVYSILDWFPWLTRSDMPPPPKEPTLSEMQRNLVRMDGVIETLRADLSAAREQLGNVQRYADMLNSITARQDSELVNMSTALSATQEQLRAAIEDKHYQASQIQSLQVEVAELKVQLAASNEARAQSDQKRTALQLALDESERENRRLRSEVAALRGSA